jgi:tRNA pseudouridine55 synthase
MENTPDEGRVLLIDKPREWTSFDVVNKLCYKLKIKKIGHAGTLDPLATGLLIICAGKMTKKIEEFVGLEKEYTGTFVLGSTTPSFDLETEVTKVADVNHLSASTIKEATQKFTGIIDQVPPAHSAIRIGGKRAYELARKGEEAVLKPRQVEIKEFEIMRINLPTIAFKIVCSKGTYIRSLARDFGEALGVGAYMSSLQRTRIGPYKLENALQVDQVE